MTDQMNGNGDPAQNQPKPECGCVLLMGPNGVGILINVLTPENGMARQATQADLIGLVANAQVHLQAQASANLAAQAAPKIVPAAGGFRFPGRRR